MVSKNLLYTVHVYITLLFNALKIISKMTSLPSFVSYTKVVYYSKSKYQVWESVAFY